MEGNRMRKIEVQSPEDIRYLFDNLCRAAKEKIDQHLPPGAADRDDELRKRVEEMLTEYVRRTFEHAVRNISVNGMDAGPIETYISKNEMEELEPYDRKLHTRFTTLQAQLDEETEKLAKLRREAPFDAAKAYEDALKRELEGDERIIQSLANEDITDPEAGSLGIRPLERKEDIEEDYARTAEILKALQTSLPATAHKLTRANDALDYVQSKQ
ncbi:uncharacterized protein LAJ45_04256 [Morchella importuna]|uniref:Kinetochore protein mis14 n=1 Tax=Morchella conica CCBAS932 TaxID=1392247 RepID=A0A3N4L169_9PEZI|nr:uncharacterized protein LAJ45_04256 [Morchella importuna]KAH8151634.1 hypothetical protein LAJ45_04256 [Morchella importuna]RPB15242.1 hypothetical protein P167DRAFT_603527 [Morchella conica CCBAS932]